MTDQDREAFEEWFKTAPELAFPASTYDCSLAWLAARDHYAKHYRELVEAVEKAEALRLDNASSAYEVCDAVAIAAKIAAKPNARIAELEADREAAAGKRVDLIDKQAVAIGEQQERITELEAERDRLAQSLKILLMGVDEYWAEVNPEQIDAARSALAQLKEQDDE